jgi:hypothetical protein
MISRRWLWLICLLPSLAIAAPADERGLPPMEQLGEMLEQKQYQPLLQTIARVLALRGEAAKAYDRGKVLLLKGEAHLRMKAGGPAVAAFNEAAEEATDPTDVAVGRATALLIKRSDQFKYKPQTGGLAKVAAHDILADRKAAFEALRDDELAEVTPKVRYARGAKTLPAIIGVVKSTQHLRALEMVTTGEAAETRKLLDGLADHAAKLLNDEIFKMETRLATMEKEANEIIPVRDRLPDGQIISSHRRQGLTDRDMKEIRSIIGTCEKIVPVSEELSELFSADDSRFAGAAGGAARLYEQAKTVLQTDYTGMAERLSREQRR